MFEHYNEKARQSVFFARFEAAQLSSTHMEPQHLLLGILRADQAWGERLFGSQAGIEAVRQRFPPDPAAPRISLAADLPLNNEAKRALAYAAEECEKLGHKQIGPEHLLIGIACDEKTAAAQVLREAGFTAEKLRELAKTPAPAVPPVRDRELFRSPESGRNLTAAATAGAFGPLIGREREIDRMVQILLRRTKHNVALIGEPGVGKTAVIEGLAQRIAQGLPSKLAEYDLVSLDASALVAPRSRIETYTPTIVCIEGLFDLAVKGSHWTLLETMHVLEPRLARSEFQCIATGTPGGLRRTLEKAATLAHLFEVVDIREPDEPEAIRIVSALLPQYEKFHDVTFAEGIAEAAVYASGRFLPHRFLPDRALDLIDEAAAAVKLRRESRTEAKMEPQHHTVTVEEIAAVIAARTDLPVEAVRNAWKQPTGGTWQRVLRALAGEIKPEGSEWLPFLAVWLARSSPQEVEKLVEAMRQAKAGQSRID
jgi:ATP-dependent Clp protease ATP-binding subunit ClpC